MCAGRQVNVGTPAEQQANIVASFGETLTFFIVSANEYVLQAQAPDLDPAALAEQAKGTPDQPLFLVDSNNH